MSKQFSSWPEFSQEEADAISALLLSNKVNYWTGQECREFESEFAEFSETNHAIALCNGTVALDLALVGLGIGAHNGGAATDEVIVTPRSFLASASTVVNAGAVPVFAEIDLNSGNITAQSIAQEISPKTKAVIAVHLAGWPCDMDPIMQLAELHGLKVIEDCAQAHGARYKGRSVGSIGHLAAWSFCQDKIMTTGGEGGMVTTNDHELWSKMWSYKDHGKSWESVYEREHKPGFRWLHDSFGTNWRMTEMQAAIGRIQLSRMVDWTEKRTSNAALLATVLTPFSTEGGPIRLTNFDPVNTHAYYKFYAYVQPKNLPQGWDRDRIVAEVSKRGAPCFQGSCSEMYLEKAFDGTGWRPKHDLTNAKVLGETSLMFLVHPSLSKQEMKNISSVIHDVLVSIDA